MGKKMPEKSLPAESSESVQSIVNPAASGGMTGKLWVQSEKKIRRAYPQLQNLLTERSGDAEKWAYQAVENEIGILFVVGGDGTLSESINGLLKAKATYPRKQLPTIGLINQGTGGDFARSLGVSPDLTLALDRFKRNHSLSVDAGLVEYTAESGKTESRYFINVAGCGMAGEVVHKVNQNRRFGAFSYYYSALGQVLRYKNTGVRILTDHGADIEKKIVTLAVCNGQFFGGGMHVAPRAQISDGYFDVTILEDWNLRQKLAYSRNLYNGTIGQTFGVSNIRVKKIRIEPVNPADKKIRIDIDGENPGYLPMEISICPGALEFLG